MALALSTLYFIITGIQYWISDYLQLVLKVPADEVYYVFAFICLTAPFMGIILGGFVFSSIGGYSSPKSFLWVLLISVIGSFTGLPTPLVDDKYKIYTLIWLTLFIGAFILPTMTGIMLNSVD